LSDTARKFTFAELWAWAMEDEDFAAGRINAEEFFRRALGKGDLRGDQSSEKKTAG
jgi:hypothetical protein